MTPPVPGLTGPRGTSGSSNCRAGTALPDGPPRTAARIGRPVEEPPPRSSSSALSVVPRGASTIPGRLTWPERPQSLVPPPPPRLADQAPPPAAVAVTGQNVS